jgi:hypothetical protein
MAIQYKPVHLLAVWVIVESVELIAHGLLVKGC